MLGPHGATGPGAAEPAARPIGTERLRTTTARTWVGPRGVQPNHYRVAVPSRFTVGRYKRAVMLMSTAAVVALGLGIFAANLILPFLKL